MKRLALYAFGYVVILGVSALWFLPPVPQSKSGWIVFLLFAPPLYLLGEWLAERLRQPWWGGAWHGKVLKAGSVAGFVLVLSIFILVMSTA
ncbi:MAG TPA: hypothetical protein VGD79_06855 [Thermoanaerobaculia bacterium]|jgi:hypothetical protein